MDKYSKAKRSEIMSRCRSKNTSPEMSVRKLLHSQGFRFRLHVKILPGSPDLVLKKYSLCIFINGCFWHQHPGCKKATIPATNKHFWIEKFTQNAKRDEDAKAALRVLGWKVLVIWECQTKNKGTLLEVLSMELPIKEI